MLAVHRKDKQCQEVTTESPAERRRKGTHCEPWQPRQGRRNGFSSVADCAAAAACVGCRGLEWGGRRRRAKSARPPVPAWGAPGRGRASEVLAGTRDDAGGRSRWLPRGRAPAGSARACAAAAEAPAGRERRPRGRVERRPCGRDFLFFFLFFGGSRCFQSLYGELWDRYGFCCSRRERMERIMDPAVRKKQ